MKKQFELWLDESGSFRDEAESKKKGFNASLVGGVLLDKKVAEKVDFDSILDSEKYHATELTPKDKQEYVLPILEEMKNKYGAVQVFFENTMYEEGGGNRQLYLRIMSEGLIQLMQTLNAMYESVEVDVVIAQRQDVDSAPGKRRIEAAEYIRQLKRCMNEKRKQHRMMLNEDSGLKYDIRVANSEQCLQIADFACNTRLIRTSKIFTDYQERINALYRNAMIFSLYEFGSINYIKQSLISKDVSDAIMELYTTVDEIDSNSNLDLIINCMKNMSYRHLKQQLSHCASEIVSYITREDDYRIGERFLERIYSEIIPLLIENGFLADELRITILLYLSDMYTKEGNIIMGQKYLNECEEIFLKKDFALEDLEKYYQLQEKNGLLAIKSFKFEEATEIMENACDYFEYFLNNISETGLLMNYSNRIKSKFYGDALCMKIYAMMFMINNDDKLYNQICSLSDFAMCQYPKEEGELERHRQYRSYVEMTQGNVIESIRWLMKAKLYEFSELNLMVFKDFLDVVFDTEPDVSIRYYLMYYLSILLKAMESNNQELSEIMYKALISRAEMMKFIGIRVGKTENERFKKIDISEILEEDSGIDYHPMEMIYWKFGSIMLLKKNFNAAIKFFERGIKICQKNEAYISMRIIGIGISSERLICLSRMEKRSLIKDCIKEIRLECEDLCNKALPEKTKGFIIKKLELIEETFSDSNSCNEEMLIESARLGFL